jgi:hypothetical protein
MAVVFCLQAGDLYALGRLDEIASGSRGESEIQLTPVAMTNSHSATATFLPIYDQSEPSDTPSEEEVGSEDDGAAPAEIDGVPNFALVGDGGDLGERTRKIASRLMPIMFAAKLNDVLYVDLTSVLSELDAGSVRSI